MINIEFAFNLILGLAVLIIVFALFLLRAIKYELSRDFDIFFASLGLGYSIILILNGWRLDPILVFSQLLIILIFIGVIWENFRLRGLIFLLENKKIKNQSADIDDFLNLEESLKLGDSLNLNTFSILKNNFIEYFFGNTK
jgi:hypothetical protein